MSGIGTLEQEADDLALHVELCAQRYQQLDNRLESLETKVDSLSTKVNDLRGDIWKVLIGTVGTIVASVISVLIVLLLK